MTPSIFRSKFKAALIHLLATAVLAMVVIMAVNHFWFPYGTLRLLKGWEIFLVLIVCDVALGPVLSFVVFNPQKKRREKATDYVVIVIIQLAALMYGLHILSQNRLVFLVYAVDRYEAVSAGDLLREDIAKAQNPEWRHLGYTKNFVVGVQPLDASSEKYFSMVFSGLEGRDLQFFPELYRDLNFLNPPVSDKVQELDKLTQEARLLLKRSIPKSRNQASVGWLPLSREKIFWTMLVDKSTGEPIHALAIDPYENLK